MPATKTCPRCGAEAPPNAPAGICPRCLMEAGLENASNSQADQPIAPTIQSPGASSGFAPPEVTVLADKFPQLEIVELLGHGGMGAVYKARQVNLDRLVALKIIRPEATHNPAFAERFNREARALARLNHPHIVTVHHFGEIEFSDGADRQPRPLYFFIMEYVEGADLRELIRAGELTPEQALAIVPQICEALQFAHEAGVVHRDIKPENILLDIHGRVKIADFGLAKLASQSPDDLTLTAAHQVMGSPRYMAPEQMEGSHAVDHRADIYSLGVVFYEMLTGEAPAGHFEPPSKKVEVDVRLDEVVLRALARDPERRYQEASEVKTDVESISSSLAASVPLPPGSSADASGEPASMLLAAIMNLVCLSLLLAGVGMVAAAYLIDVPSDKAFWTLIAWGLPIAFAGVFSFLAHRFFAARERSRASRLKTPVARRSLYVLAILMAVGNLFVVGGVVLLAIAVRTQEAGTADYWLFMETAFYCVFAAAGVLLPCWNWYLQLEGREGFVNAGRWNWFDGLWVCWTAAGVALFAGALAFSHTWSEPTVNSLLTLSAVIVFSGGLFIVSRALRRRAAASNRDST